jgi:hypothetical protein
MRAGRLAYRCGGAVSRRPAALMALVAVLAVRLTLVG